MKTRLDADKTATAGTGRDPTKGGGWAPDQNVTYSAQGLMGSSNSATVRATSSRAWSTHSTPSFGRFLGRTCSPWT